MPTMTSAHESQSPCHEALFSKARALKLHGLLAHFDELQPPQLQWLETLLQWEEQERNRRGLVRRLRAARIGSFKPLADFDWDWPTQCDKAAVLELMTLNFINEANNLILIGPNGIGKSMIAKNIAHQGLINGHTVLFTNAAQMLGELAALDGDNALRRRLAHYARPDMLVVDEIGYLSYANRHADLLFDIINRRYEKKSTLITTNRPFAEWAEVFPNAACVVSIIDRLVHHSEVIVLDGESYRAREARQRANNKAKEKRNTPTKRNSKVTSTRAGKTAT
jgi:DNA replication protein DnaC